MRAQIACQHSPERSAGMNDSADGSRWVMALYLKALTFEEETVGKLLTEPWCWGAQKVGVPHFGALAIRTPFFRVSPPGSSLGFGALES